MTSTAPLSADSAHETPLWVPPEARKKASQMANFALKAGLTPGDGNGAEDFHALWRWSVDKPDQFWSLLWDFCGVVGDKGETILKDGHLMPGATFFPEARLNFAENLLRRRDDAPGMIFHDEAGTERTLSFADIYNAVSRWAQALRLMGVKRGDRVAGYMPNMPETAIAMMAAVSIGAIWSSASPDFGVQGVVDRFGQIEPSVLVTVDGYRYNGKVIDCLAKLKEIQPRLPTVQKTIVVPFVHENPDLGRLTDTVTAPAFIKAFVPENIAFERVPFDHPLFIMFSSGTTGVPKCIVHGHGGPLLQCLKEHRLHCDVRRDDRIFYFSTCGWMMWNWLVGALASEACLLLYDGSPFHPNPNVLWDFTARHQCTLFGTAAKYIDALKSAGMRPCDTHDLSALKVITSTGSPLVHESFDYVYDAIKKDVHLASISGGTDIVSCFVLGNPLSPVYRGEIQGPGLGLAVDVFDDQGKPIPPGAGSGELVCTKPFPSMPVKFWNDEGGEKYIHAYFSRFDGIWVHGDWIERTIHDGFIIHGRSDATLNPGGVRIGTAEIYRQVEQIEDVVESIAIGQDWKGDARVVLFVKLREGASLSDALKDRIRKQIRAGASPRHVPAKILKVNDIPRTKSGKIVELAVRDIVHGRPIRNVEALANPEALAEYKDIAALQVD